jgi:hypothetical protein
VTRQVILSSTLLWERTRQGYRVQRRAEKQLGHAVELTRVTVKGKQLWQWSGKTLMCVGVCNTLAEAQVAALEEVLRLLGSPRNYAAFQKLAKLTGQRFS